MPKPKTTALTIRLTDHTCAQMTLGFAKAKQRGEVLELDRPVNLVLRMLFNGGIPGIPSVFKSRAEVPNLNSKWLDSENLILRAHMCAFGYSTEAVKSVRAFLPGRTFRSIETHYRRLTK